MDVDPGEVFEDVVEELSPRGVTAGRMFGARSMMLNGKAVACLTHGMLAVKLGRDEPEHAAALALEGAEVWEPGGQGKPFHDWVALPPEQVDEWSRLAGAAVDWASR
ncbi:hypothetical protein [Aeromicrobium sp.]|uniref:hypothetical protein n=1 Tax=Aeromicrobium sp. TaxID=1871063 RepID=UPI003C66A3F2